VGLRSFFTRRRTPAAGESSAVVAATEREPLTPAQLADLEVAWAELRQAVQESGVTSFHACTRDGSRWQDNPESVRAMADTIRRTQKYTAEGLQDGPAR
jgi:DNA-binding transcriptional regulator YdaS (Cro superfamily)